MRYAISHKTTYEYNNLVSVSHHLIRLQPRDLPYQRTLNFQLNAEPLPALLDSHEDYFGNLVSFVTIEGPHRQLVVSSECQVEVLPKPAPVPASTPAWETAKELCR